MQSKKNRISWNKEKLFEALQAGEGSSHEMRFLFDHQGGRKEGH